MQQGAQAGHPSAGVLGYSAEHWGCLAATSCKVDISCSCPCLSCRMSADTAMYDMFKLFQSGRSHMVVITDKIQHTAASEAGTTAAGAAAAALEEVPIGIITIEDVIEELMQTEISKSNLASIPSLACAVLSFC